MKKVIYKCRNIHRFSDRKNVKPPATCEMLRDVSHKKTLSMQDTRENPFPQQKLSNSPTNKSCQTFFAAAAAANAAAAVSY